MIAYWRFYIETNFLIDATEKLFNYQWPFPDGGIEIGLSELLPAFIGDDGCKD